MNVVFRGVLIGLCAVMALPGLLAASRVRAADAGGGAALLIDGTAVSGDAVIAAGGHTVTARADADIVCVVVFENGRFAAASFDGTLEHDFPNAGAQIKLICLDSAFRPLREAVQVTQAAPAQTLVYTGEAACTPDEDEQFEAYTVRLKVVTKGGVITEIRDIAGYDAAGNPVGSANALFLNMASAQVPDRIVSAQATENIDAVTGATCASEAIVRAVEAALKTTPTAEAETGGEETPVPDGVYAGSAQCLTGYMNYLVDVDVTVENGVVTAVQDRTLQTPLSTKDKGLYAKAWKGVSNQVAEGGLSADSFRAVDAVSGATISSGALNAAIADALSTRTTASETAGEVYAPPGISLYARTYPVVTVENDAISNIRIVPAEGADADRLAAFADEIVRRQSVTGLAWPEDIADDAFAVANLTDQILYGTGVLE